MKSLFFKCTILAALFLTGCGTEYPLTGTTGTPGDAVSDQADTFIWKGEKTLPLSQTIPAGTTYWCAPGTQLLLQENSTISIRGSLILSGTENAPVRIYCPPTATFSIKGKMKAAHLISNGSGGTLFSGAGGSCILNDIEVNGYSIAINGYFSSLNVRNAEFTENGVAIALAPSGDFYSSSVQLADLTLSGIRITGAGRQTGTGLSINGVIAYDGKVLVQQALFNNLKCAVSYAISENGTHFTAVNVTIDNCIDGFTPQNAQAKGFDTMIVSNSDLSTRNPAISLTAAQSVNLFITENSNVLSKTAPPMNIAGDATTSVQINQAALLDKSGKAYTVEEVYESIANSAHVGMIVLDTAAITGRGMGHDFLAVDSTAGTTDTVASAIPAVPIIVSVVGGSGSITVSWLPSTRAAAYNLYYAAGDSVDKTGAKITTALSPKTIAGLADGTNYTFAVCAVNNRGESALSLQKSVRPLVKPSAPQIASAVASDGAVTVMWDAVPMADSYNLYFNKGSGVDSASAKFTNATSPKTVSGLTNGMLYSFAVSAVNDRGESAPGPHKSVKPLTKPSAPPIASVAASDGAAIVTWNAVPMADSYNLYYRKGSGVDTASAKFTHVTSPKTVSGLTNGIHYTFAVSAVNDAGESDLSAEDSAVPIGLLAAPVITAGTAGNGMVTLSWEPVSGATSYNIYYTTGGTATKSDARIADATSPKTISDLVNGTTYTFSVSAVAGSTESPLSAISTTMPNSPPVAPVAPLNVTATADNGSVTVDWETVTGVLSYKVYYAPGLTVDKSGAVFTDTSSRKSVRGLTNGMVYAFAVSAINAAGESQLSRITTATPITAPGAPVITVIVPGDSTVTVSWSAVALATTYNLYYAIGTAVNKTSLKLASATSPAIVPALTNGTTYAFAVAAANSSGESGLSGMRTATPSIVPPLAPTGITVTPTDSQEVTVSWEPVSGAVSYTIYYAPGTTVDTTGTKIVNVTSPETIDHLTTGVLWAFCVTAVNAGGESAASAADTATLSAK